MQVRTIFSLSMTDAFCYSKWLCWRLTLGGRTAPAHPNTPRGTPMEAERTNTIRSQLDDLTTRVVELRRYL